MIVSRLISELLIDLCLRMEDTSGCRFIHRVTDKIFDNLSLMRLITSNIPRMGRKITKRSLRKMKFQPSWLLKTDPNGDKVKDYLRPVKKKPYQAYCAADNSLLNIGTRGWSQIYDHAKKNKH